MPSEAMGVFTPEGRPGAGRFGAGFLASGGRTEFLSGGVVSTGRFASFGSSFGAGVSTGVPCEGRNAPFGRLTSATVIACGLLTWPGMAKKNSAQIANACISVELRRALRFNPLSPRSFVGLGDEPELGHTCGAGAPDHLRDQPVRHALVRPQVDGTRGRALLLERLAEVGEMHLGLVEHDAAARL